MWIHHPVHDNLQTVFIVYHITVVITAPCNEVVNIVSANILYLVVHNRMANQLIR